MDGLASINRRQMILAAGASMATLASRPTFASPELTEHEGFVASRARLVYSMTEAYKQIMSRSCHFANEDLKSIKLIFANFRPGGAGDLKTGSAATISASIEFPAGTVTPIYFQGERIGSVADVGSITSDYAAVSIPNGSPFWVRLFYTSRSAIIFNLCNSYLGEQSRVGTGELTDQTSTGDVLYGGTPQNWILPPSAIIGKTKKQSVLIVGDSRSKGQGDKENASNTTLGRDGKVGNIARSMGASPIR